MGMEKEIKKNLRSGLAGYLKAGEENHKRRRSYRKNVARRWRTKRRNRLLLTRMLAVEESAWPERKLEETGPGGITIMQSHWIVFGAPGVPILGEEEVAMNYWVDLKNTGRIGCIRLNHKK